MGFGNPLTNLINSWTQQATNPSGGISYSGDAIGTIKPSSKCGACGPAVQAQSSCSEFGDEWKYSGYGSCGACKFNCVSFGSLGKACTSGTNAQCQKFQYTGSVNQCCLGKMPSGYPNVTCDPAYTPLAPACSSVVQGYCSTGSNIFTDPVCQSWAAANPTQAFTAKKGYCTPSLIKTDKNCQDWVRASDSQGQIDDVMTSYCQSNPTDSLCACINSEIPCPNKFDMKCVQSGYETTDMMKVTCPNVLNCTQFLSLSPGAQALATNVQQNCSATSGNVPTSVTNSSALWTSNEYVIMFAILLLIISVVLVITYSRRNKKNIFHQTTS